jgi:hypothetical protein
VSFRGEAEESAPPLQRPIQTFFSSPPEFAIRSRDGSRRFIIQFKDHSLISPTSGDFLTLSAIRAIRG